MNQYLRFLTLTALLLVSAVASAQNLIFYQNTQSQAYLFKQGGGGPSAPLVDYFIGRIAQGSNKPANRTEYILVHDDIIRLTKVGPMQFDVQASLGGFRITGDFNYRGFNISELLNPGAVKFRLEHRDKTGKVKQGWDFGDVPLNESLSQIANFRATDSSAAFTTDVVAVADKQFVYTDANRLAFDARTNLIDEYYQSGPTLETIHRQLKLVDPGKFEQIDVQDTDLKNQQAKIEAIRAKQYPQLLALTAQNDPAGFLAKFNEIDAMAKSKAAAIADVRTRVHVLYHERGLAHLQTNKADLAKADFLKAINISPKFAPAHVELARLSYAEGLPAEAVNRLQYVFAETQFDEATRQKAAQLGTTIYQSRLTNANFAIQQSDFEKALGECDLAKDLCKRVPAVTCGNDLENAYSRAHRGLYLRSVTNGVKAENEKRLDVAEQDALAAMEYQKKFPLYIGEPREAKELLGRVRVARYNAMVLEGEQLLKAGKLQDAENRSREAFAYQAAHATEVADPAPAKKLLDRVMAAKYSQLISASAAKATAADHKGALEGYEAAKAIEQDHEFKRDTTLGTKIKVQAKQVMLADGKRGLELARSNRLPEAREVGGTFNRMMDQHGLNNDVALGAMKKELQAAIFSQECVNANNEYSKLATDAELLRLQKKFMEANAGWTKAVQFANQNAACGIDIKAVMSAQALHIPAVNYQDKVKKADDAYGNANYGGSINLYNEAGDMFYAGGLDQAFGLNHAPLLDYVLNTMKQDFMLAAAGHFCDKKAYESSLKLVYEISTKGYPKSRLKAIQARLGKELAIRDKQNDPGADPKLTAAGYTRAQKSMAGLGKAYLKQWKSM